MSAPSKKFYLKKGEGNLFLPHYNFWNSNYYEKYAKFLFVGIEQLKLSFVAHTDCTHKCKYFLV